MKVTAEQVATSYRLTADTQHVMALVAVRALRTTLANVEAALAAGVHPAGSTDGDVGLVSRALDVQRHVDAWRLTGSMVTAVTLDV